jgi:hypothetical protein
MSQVCARRTWLPVFKMSNLNTSSDPSLPEFGTLLNCTHAELIEHAVALYRHRFVSAGMFENSVYTGIERALAALQAEKAQLYVTVACKFLVAAFS